MNIIEKFISKLGEPIDTASLNSYVKLFSGYSLPKTEEYCENHHILPRSLFPEFVNEEWNIVRILYKDHILAHKLLFSAYPIPKFYKPLNMMLQGNVDKHLENYKELKSDMFKEIWKELKLNEVKYSEWKNKRRNHMFKAHEEGFYLEKRIYTEEQKIEKSESMKTYWESDESQEHRNSLSKDNIGPERRSKIQKQVWNNRSEEKNEEQKERLRSIAAEGSKKGAEISKILWQTEEYRSKMKEAHKGMVCWTNGTVTVKSKECPGEGFVRGRHKNMWEDTEYREMMLSRRKGLCWFNDGNVELKSKECPGEGFVRGRLKK
jgi:hypothetical protein